jgi:transposase
MTMMTRVAKNSPKVPVQLERRLHVAFELSSKQWKLVMGTELGSPPRIRTVPARDLVRVMEEIAEGKRRFGLPADAPVDSCYEAGRDGFWLHRYLVAQRINNFVVDPASIEVDRRRRRRKTDRIDGIKLWTRLIRQSWGEKVWSVVRVPSEEDEDRRRAHRERERLVHERVRHQGRIRGLLAAVGVHPKALDEAVLNLFRPGGEGRPLPRHLHAELKREFERMEMVTRHIDAVETEFKEMAKEGTPTAQKVAQLRQLKAVGLVTSQVLGYEFFGWRTFRNGGEVGALAGLTGTPYDSGELNREQGISKAGNSRVRAVMTELAWNWLRYQANSALAHWFATRFGDGPARLRRIGIVALARKLLVALWRFVEHGQVPEGAILARAK